MKFNSAEDILEFIQDGNDLWSPSEDLYVFVYNEDGAICTYNIDVTQAKELSLKADLYDECWSAFLGWGGSIYDPPKNLELCEVLYVVDDWRLTTNIFEED
jgi:hypothetical protein